MKPSRILFIHSGSDIYGASRSLLRLSTRLAKDGITVQVVLPSYGPLVAKLRENGVTVMVQNNLAVMERHKVRSFLGLLKLSIVFLVSILSMLLLIKRFQPDLVHTMTSVVLSSGPASKLAGVPHLWHVREFFGDFGKLWRYYQYFLLWFSTRLICVSTPVAEQFNHFSRNKKIIVIHNGFPATEFESISADRVEQFRANYLSFGAKELVGVVGRIKFRRKGQEVFVKAASLLQDKYPHARFLCIGTPYPGNESHLTNLCSLIQELNLDGYVQYTGEIEDIKAAIKGLDVLVLASAQPEPFGGVVIEAMALERPVVATAIGGSLEQVVDGVTGYLVEPGNPVSMAEGIARLLESSERRKRFGAKGRARYLDKFEFEPFYQTVLDLYAETIEIRWRERQKPSVRRSLLKR